MATPAREPRDDDQSPPSRLPLSRNQNRAETARRRAPSLRIRLVRCGPLQRRDQSPAGFLTAPALRLAQAVMLVVLRMLRTLVGAKTARVYARLQHGCQRGGLPAGQPDG